MVFRVRDDTEFTRYGGWIPRDIRVYSGFHKRLALGARSRRGTFAQHEPSVQEFKEAIEKDPVMTQLFDKIFLQASKEYNFTKVETFEELLHALDQIVVEPPKFEVVVDEEGNAVGEPVGVPIYLLLDILSNTSAAYDLFRMPAFNEAMKNLLNQWGDYLSGRSGPPDSNKSLNTTDQGWFGTAGMAKLESNGRGRFQDTYYLPNPEAENFGYQTWDEFFTRAFKDDTVRPIIKSGNPDIDRSLIYNACECTPFRIASDVGLHDQFWLKGQPYSLYDMLNGDKDRAETFVGGTVFQAFLGPQDFHRWNAPVKGKIVDATVLDGTYYAVIPDAGAEIGDPDLRPGDPRGALIRSQPFLSLAATRAIIYIEPDNKELLGDLICFIGIGMCEVSTCDLSEKSKNKQPVEVGDELGMFHFGGSTHTLIFQDKAAISFADEVEIDKHLKIHSILARAYKKPDDFSSKF